MASPAKPTDHADGASSGGVIRTSRNDSTVESGCARNAKGGSPIQRLERFLAYLTGTSRPRAGGRGTFAGRRRFLRFMEVGGVCSLSSAVCASQQRNGKGVHARPILAEPSRTGSPKQTKATLRLGVKQLETSALSAQGRTEEIRMLASPLLLVAIRLPEW